LPPELPPDTEPLSGNGELGDGNVQDMIDSFGRDPWPRLDRLSFISMGISDVLLVAMRDAGFLDRLTDLNLSDNPQDNYLFTVLGDSPLPRHLTRFTARRLNYEVMYRVPADRDRALRA
jgi:hypothetical protein